MKTRVALSACLFLSYATFAQVPESPVIKSHVAQADIESGVMSFDEIFHLGKKLFDARFNTLDGQGRPATTGGGAPRMPDEPAFIRTSGPDATSCAGCHAQPRSGGAGDFVANVFVLAQTLDPVTTSVDPLFSNERNTLGMMGAGSIEMLARELTAELIAIRDAARADAANSGQRATRPLVAKGISFGAITVLPDGKIDPSAIEGVDWDLIIKPFHQKGAVVSLRQFTNNAMNHHHGIQSAERFGDDLDPDQDGITNELSVGDVTVTTIYQAALATPGRVITRGQESAIAEGEQLFSAIGCTTCHVSEFRLASTVFSEPNPYNPGAAIDKPNGNLTIAEVGSVYAFDMATEGELPRIESDGYGGAIIRPFTDLKRHDLTDEDTSFFGNEQLAQGKLNGFAPASDFTQDPGPRPLKQFLTRKLWDVGNSAPFGHRGDCTTLSEAIQFHGGEARQSRVAFQALSSEDQGKIIAFLYSMQVLPEGAPSLTMNADENGEIEAWSREVPLDQINTCGPISFIPVGLLISAFATAKFRMRRTWHL
ncbi:MAG: hypothetical protein JNG88_05080 [Phycisphaerales bacterium]|nr:hypothetical protein [Phycisphaerales bacterium]